MGRHDITVAKTPAQRREYTKALLRDLDALAYMVGHGHIESGVRRLGVEQELFLADNGWRPAPIATQILDALDGQEFTTELGLFNMEINMDPMVLGGRCFSDLRAALTQKIMDVEEQAQRFEGHTVLTGILPTLIKSDLSKKNFTPEQRYFALNDIMNAMRGGLYRLHIRGTDELNLEHDNVLLEACNTSFQVHLQASADEFIRIYNIAQAVTAPVLAAATNSPLLLGRQLWCETRIALFQQSIDTRRTASNVRQVTPRVRFGEQWSRGSVTDIYREDIARIPAIMPIVVGENPFDQLDSHKVPKLEALQLFNGTVYRWNRPCYGLSNGKPHLRIECRVLPSGPSVVDEVANAAFWIGSILGVAERYGDVTRLLEFDEARANLIAAARRGLDAGFTWLEGKALSAQRLILDHLLPLADLGLKKAGVEKADSDEFLGVIAARVAKRATGARWIRASLANMANRGVEAERMAALTATIAKHQLDGSPSHEWPLADLKEAGGVKQNYRIVEQIMTKDLFTVREDELLDLAAVLMDWKHVRQIPVEDDDNRLIGLVSYGAALRHLARSHKNPDEEPLVPVSEVMDRKPVTVEPEALLRDAVALMRLHRVTGLPVVKDGKLVGIVTIDDFLPMVERMLEG